MMADFWHRNDLIVVNSLELCKGSLVSLEYKNEKTHVRRASWTSLLSVKELLQMSQAWLLIKTKNIF